MKIPKVIKGGLIGSVLIAPLSLADLNQGQHSHAVHGMHFHSSSSEVKSDSRELVLYPRPIYEATLGNMREHLRGIHQVQQLVGEGRFTAAAEAAERGLGMGHNHGAQGNAAEHQYMPQGMRRLGSAMHHSATELALTLRDAEVTEDLQSVFMALGKVTANCVACHDAYRLGSME